MLLLAALLAASLPALADDKQQEGEALLVRARQLLEMRAPGNPAFRLAAQFRLADSSVGSVQGTYQEVWVSPQQWRREINAGSYHQIEIGADNMRWAMHPLSGESARFNEVRPILALAAVDPKRPKIRKIYDETIADARVRCVEVKLEDNTDAISCLDAASGLPLSYEFRTPGRVQAIWYSDYASFGGHSYPRKTSEFLNGKLDMEFTITDLIAEPSPDPSLFAHTDDWQPLPSCSTKVAAPQAVSSPDTKYEPKGKSISVILWVIIETDGTVRDPKVARTSGDSKFDAAAMDAVRQWHFKPAKCNGQPIPVPINIAFGSSGF